MSALPLFDVPKEFGNPDSWWVEYPSGLVDLSRSHHLPATSTGSTSAPDLAPGQVDIRVNDGRTIRVDTSTMAYIIIDMQKQGRLTLGIDWQYPLLKSIPIVRLWGSKVLWVNWGLTEEELEMIPPALGRGFQKRGSGGLGFELKGGFGRQLMRGAKNSDLYGPLKDEYERGAKAGTDFWIHKNRISALWGTGSPLDTFLKENGIRTLLFAGVNSDQCVLGTLADAYCCGYDCILVEDATATTSPEGGYNNVIHNSKNSYGFVTDSGSIVAAISSQ